MTHPTDTLYVLLADMDGAVPADLIVEVAQVTLPPHFTRYCEVCEATLARIFYDGTVERATFTPHTYAELTGVALCLPCQMAHVAQGYVALCDLQMATSLTRESEGRHAA